jgi:hypothetical protein
MKKTLKRFSPKPSEIKSHKKLGWLSQHLNEPSLWNFNRRSISKAFAVGLFCAFIPIPFQMVLAAPSAIIFSANLPISIALVWITNPLTMPIIFYAAYKLGAWILDTPIEKNFMQSIQYVQQAHGDISEMFTRIGEVFGSIWQPFLLGNLLFSVVSSVIGYWIIQLIYRNRRNKRKRSRSY